MDSLGKPIPWTEGAIIAPKALDGRVSCVLKFGGLQIDVDQNSSSPMRGHYIQCPDSLAAEFVGRFLRCSYELVRLVPLGGGNRLPNGTWEGPMGLLQRGQLDMSLVTHGLLAARMEAVRFTRVIAMSQLITILSKEYDEGLAAFSILKLATSSIWTLMLVSFLVTSIVLAVKEAGDRWISPESFKASLFTCWASLLAQPTMLTRSVAAGTWLFGSYILIKAISGEMTSIICVPSVSFVSSLQDLVHVPRYRSLKIYTLRAFLAYKFVLKVSDWSPKSQISFPR